MSVLDVWSVSSLVSALGQVSCILLLTLSYSSPFNYQFTFHSFEQRAHMQARAHKHTSRLHTRIHRGVLPDLLVSDPLVCIEMAPSGGQSWAVVNAANGLALISQLSACVMIMFTSPVKETNEWVFCREMYAACDVQSRLHPPLVLSGLAHSVWDPVNN